MDKYTKILVTGCKGQIGTEVMEELAKRGYDNVSGIDIGDLDLKDEIKVTDYICQFAPEVIIHTAGYTGVDRAENAHNSYPINALAAKYIAVAAEIVGAKMIYISTEKVFDGLKDGEYEVDDVKNPLSAYGSSKSIGENFVNEYCSQAFILRSSWVYSKHGHGYLNTFLETCKSGATEIPIANDRVGSPTYAEDLARVIVDLIETNKYGTYHATNEGYISLYDFMKLLVDKMGISVNLKSVTYEEYNKLNPGLAKRPKNARLSKKSLDEIGIKRLPSIEDALDRFLMEE